MDVLDEGAANTSELVTPLGITYLKKTYPWIRFLGVLGIIGGVLYMLMAFFAGSIFSMAGGMDGMEGNIMAGAGVFMGIIYFLVGALVAYVGYLLYGYGTKLKTGLEIKDANQIERAFKDQKNYFLITGILALIGVSFAALGFLVAIFGGMAASM